MEQSNSATRYICNLVNALCAGAQVHLLPEHRFRVKANQIDVVLQFSRAEIDDFTAAWEDYRDSADFFTVENRIKFRIYIALGREGLLDELKISQELIDEKGAWDKSVLTNVTFEEDFAQTLCKGLRLLNDTLTVLSSSTDVEIQDIEKDAENIRNLIKYYEEEGHLSSPGAQHESLSYLKGAAICVIATFEREKQKSNMVRLRKGFDREIYAIVEKLREEPFQGIQAPECAREFLTQQSDAEAPLTSSRTKERLYVDEIDSFRKVRDFTPDMVSNALNQGRLERLEDEVQKDLEQILDVSFHKTDWGGEQNDLYSTNMIVHGARTEAAFLLKGKGCRSREMQIADCGKNGDQLVRLFQSPARLFVVQYIGPISEMVVSDVLGKVREKRATGKDCNFLILDGQDTARLLLAYGKLLV